MSFIDEIAAQLVAQNVGVLGANIFLGSASPIPTGVGPYLTVNETGGIAPTRTQNQAAASTQRPTAQILVRGTSYPVTRAKALAAYLALDGVFNTTLSGTKYLRMTARQEPTDMGLDANGRVQLVFNIEAEKQPS